MNLLPFNSVKTCPACGIDVFSPSVKFSTQRKIPAGNGQFVIGQTTEDSQIPHLEKHCGNCGFGWLEHVMSHPEGE